MSPKKRGKYHTQTAADADRGKNSMRYRRFKKARLDSRCVQWLAVTRYQRLSPLLYGIEPDRVFMHNIARKATVDKREFRLIFC